MRVILSLFLGLSSLFLLNAASVYAQTLPANGCQTVYGGGPSCVQSGDLTLDKKIRNPLTNQYVDHLNPNDPRYVPDQIIVFQITIKNIGGRAIEKITITDYFPQYVTFSRGPGQFDRTLNTLSFGIDKLEAGQSRSIMIEGKVAPAQAIPLTDGVTCVVNQANATQNKNIGSDNSSFCLQPAGVAQPEKQQPQQSAQPTPRPNMPVYETPNSMTAPKTGPEMLALIGLLPAGAMGWYLRKKTN